MNSLLDSIRKWVRLAIRTLARFLNKLTGGNLSPNGVTIIGLLAHIPIAWLIATGRNNVLGAILLVVFGLFDTLDGELARLQGRASPAGMLLDATTDRMKEIILYIGVAANIMNRAPLDDALYGSLTNDVFNGLLLIVAACGGSLLVSYVKAKGETAIKDTDLTPNEINRLFQDGLARFEVRMALLVIGLLFNRLFFAVLIIAVLSWFTAISRLVKISRKIKHV